MLLYGSTLGVYFATTIIPCASDELRKVIDTAQPLISEETVCVDVSRKSPLQDIIYKLQRFLSMVNTEK